MNSGELMRLDVLPTGITCAGPPAEADTQAVDPKAFAAACFQAARSLGSHKVEVGPDSGYGTFLKTTISARDETVAVLCNRRLPFVAFVATDENELMGMRFLSPPSILSAFAALTDFRPFDPTWLASAYSPELVGRLGQPELDDLRYWKPSQVGDLLFNGWD